MIALIEEQLDLHPKAPGFIFDGFPRTVAQAEALDAALARRGAQVHSVIRLKVDEPALIARIAKRFQDEGRADDNPESFKIRLDAYNRQTAPLLPLYAAQNKLAEVDGMAAVEVVSAAISKAIEAAAQSTGQEVNKTANNRLTGKFRPL